MQKKKKKKILEAVKAEFGLKQTVRKKKIQKDVIHDLFNKTVVPIFPCDCKVWRYENLALIDQFQLKKTAHILLT